MSLRPNIQPSVEEGLSQDAASLWKSYKSTIESRGAAELNAILQHLDRILADNYDRLNVKDLRLAKEILDIYRRYLEA